VSALTDITFCEFDAARVKQLLSVDSLAYQVTWHEEIEARHLDERLASVGALNIKSRVAFFFAELYFRLRKRQMTQGTKFYSPLTREQVAQAVGATRMHLNRVLRELTRDGYLWVDKKTIFIADLPRLCALGKLEIQDRAQPVL
jgi:CRP-like cAMP-binding protein